MSRIRHVKRPAKPIVGTGKIIVKDNTVGGMRQMRCGACHGMMVPTRLPNGQEAFKCGGCGNTAGSRPM